MVFSDQEGKTLNSSEAPESGDSGSSVATDSQHDEAKASSAALDASVDEQGVPEIIESTEPIVAESEKLKPEETISEEASMEPESALDQPEILDLTAEIAGEEHIEEEVPQVAETDLTADIAAEPSTEISSEADETDIESPEMDQEEEFVEDDDGRAWYVVHCYSGYENKVRHNLEQRIETMGMKDMIFDIVVPTEEEIEVREGKRRTVERRVFPGYILVNMVMTEESWYVVRNTPGVTGFVGMGNTPTPLRPEEVSQIIKRMEAEAPRIKVTFKSGERVRIVDGPFNDFRGTVAEIDMERAKVRVMVNFFGRETPVELDFLQVEKT